MYLAWYVAYVAYAREKFWNMCAWHVYVHCLIHVSEQANKTGRFRIVRLEPWRYIYTLAWEVEVGAVCKGIM